MRGQAGGKIYLCRVCFTKSQWLTIFISSSSHCAAHLDMTDMWSGVCVSWQAVSLQVWGCWVPVQHIPQPHITRHVPKIQIVQLHQIALYTHKSNISIGPKRLMNVTAELLPIFHPRLRICLFKYTWRHPLTSESFPLSHFAPLLTRTVMFSEIFVTRSFEDYRGVAWAKQCRTFHPSLWSLPY